jgi:HPt (histidine-containing phosphotransfer) domain-containing protein
MNDQVDQFGRDKSKHLSDNISNERSKKILESLAEIKNQLENKDYTPKVEVNNNTLNRDVKSIKSKNLDFDLLQKRIELLEEKLINLSSQSPSENYKKNANIEEIVEFEKSIFHNFENKHDLDKGKSLLVLESQDQSKIFKFKFYHFMFVTISMTIVLILLTAYKLKIDFFAITEIFISNFN